MKYNFVIILTIILSWACSCRTNKNLQLQLESISTDSIYILKSASWQTVDTLQIVGQYGKDAKTCILEVVKFDKQSLLFITIGAVKTTADTIHFLYMYDYFGGTVIVGRQKDNFIASAAKSLNGKRIDWIEDNSFLLDSKTFIQLDKITLDEKNLFKEVIGKYCYIRGKDSLAIVTSGP